MSDTSERGGCLSSSDISKSPKRESTGSQERIRMSDRTEPVEDVDYFVIKRVRYELHVEGTFFITADEECDDFEVDAARIDFSAPIIIGETVVGSEERRIDDPTKLFYRKGWKPCTI